MLYIIKTLHTKKKRLVRSVNKPQKSRKAAKKMKNLQSEVIAKSYMNIEENRFISSL